MRHHFTKLGRRYSQINDFLDSSEHPANKRPRRVLHYHQIFFFIKSDKVEMSSKPHSIKNVCKEQQKRFNDSCNKFCLRLFRKNFVKSRNLIV